GDCFLHRCEDRDAVDVGPRLLRADAADDLGPVRAVAQPVEAALPTGEALHDHFRVRVDENAHGSQAPFAIATAVRAASTIVGLLTSRSDSCELRILRPCSALVPSSRITIGDAISTCWSACTMPLATSSPFVIPPKMLMKIDLTFGS